MVVDQWTELALVSIQKYGETDSYLFGSLIDTIDLGLGDRPIETTATIAGGRVVTHTPEENAVFTLEIFPVGAKANQTTPTGLLNWFYGNQTGVSHGVGGGTYYINSQTRYKFRITVLFTSVFPLPASADGSLASGDHLRVSLWGCYITSCKMAFTDDLLTGTVDFTCPPYSKAASGMIAVEEATAGTLPAMQDYTVTYPTPAWA